MTYNTIYNIRSFLTVISHRDNLPICEFVRGSFWQHFLIGTNVTHSSQRPKVKSIDNQRIARVRGGHRLSSWQSKLCMLCEHANRNVSIDRGTHDKSMLRGVLDRSQPLRYSCQQLVPTMQRLGVEWPDLAFPEVTSDSLLLKTAPCACGRAQRGQWGATAAVDVREMGAVERHKRRGVAEL